MKKIKQTIVAGAMLLGLAQMGVAQMSSCGPDEFKSHVKSIQDVLVEIDKRIQSSIDFCADQAIKVEGNKSYSSKLALILIWVCINFL